MPGPILYGFFKDKFKDSNPRLSWKIIIHMLILGYVASLGSSYFRYFELKKIVDEEKKNKQVKN